MAFVIPSQPPLPAPGVPWFSCQICGWAYPRVERVRIVVAPWGCDAAQKVIDGHPCTDDHRHFGVPTWSWALCCLACATWFWEQRGVEGLRVDEAGVEAVG